MKYAKLLFFAAASMLLAVSCLEDKENYQAGFVMFKPIPGYYRQIYANNTLDSLSFVSYGPWRISSDTPDEGWCHMPLTTGKAMVVTSVAVTFDQNTTGSSRSTSFTIVDTDHPSDASTRWGYIQSATRGDGSLGNAALVKTITSSDGWTASISYDELHRPVSYSETNTVGLAPRSFEVTYNDYDSLVTIRTRTGDIRGKSDYGYQADRYTGQADTVGYFFQRTSYGMELPASEVFNVEAHHLGGDYQAYAYLLGGQSLLADSTHNADSLKYKRHIRAYELATPAMPATVVEKLKLTYGPFDNRRQSVDVNQLLLGMADCHPMLLLSMFRHARNTNILSKATSADGDITVSAEYNGNGSVRKLTVSDQRKSSTVTYDFSY